VQRSTLSFQRGDRKGAWWAGYGDRHEICATGLLARVDLSKRGSDGPGRLRRPGRDMGTDTGFLLVADMGTDTVFWRPEQIEGQARCPIYRSGTFNLQRSTLSFQRGDRKGAWWAGYGDRHEICATGLLARVDLSKRGSDGPGRLRHPDMGTDTMSDIPDQERST